LYFILEYKMRA